MGPVCIRDCENLTVYCASTQLRINKSKNVTCYTFSESDPTIEKCEGLVFAPYTLRYPHLDEQFKESGLTLAFDRWNQVYDMTPNKENPCWKIMDPSIFEGIKVCTWESADIKPSNPIPIPKAFGGDLEIDIYVKMVDLEEQQGDMVYFDIKTTNQEAKMSMNTEHTPALDSQPITMPETENLNELPQESVNEKQSLLQQNTDKSGPILESKTVENKQEMPFDNSAAEAIELLEDMTQLEKLFKGIIIVGVLLFIVLVIFYNTLDESLKIHLLIMIFFDIGLLGISIYFYPTIKEIVNDDIYFYEIKDFIHLKDNELSFKKIERRNQ